MGDLEIELSKILMRDPVTYELSSEQMRNAAEIIKKEILRAADEFRVGRKIVQVHSVKPGEFSYPKRKGAAALVKVEGRFQEIDGGSVIPVEPYLISTTTPLTNEIVESLAIVPIEHLFAGIGRAIAEKEDLGFFETLLRGSKGEVEASTKGELTSQDITNARKRVENSDRLVLVVSPFQWADLAKTIGKHEREKLANRLMISTFYETNYVPDGTAVLFNRESVAIFERRPITVRLLDNPPRDSLDVITTEKVMPAVLDCDGVIKIVNC